MPPSRCRIVPKFGQNSGRRRVNWRLATPLRRDRWQTNAIRMGAHSSWRQRRKGITMSSTSQLLQERDLELDAGRTLTSAFDEAWALVRTSSSWLHRPGSEAARKILAKRIIAASGRG